MRPMALRAKRRGPSAGRPVAQSVFVDMFGEPGSEITGLDGHYRSLVEEFRYGTSNKSGECGQVPALRIPNVIGGALDLY